MEDHDLLITLSAKVDYLTTMISNHLKHHFAMNVALMVATISTLTSLIIVLIR